MNSSVNNLEELAAGAVRLARELGATDAECTVSAGDEFTTNVRMGQVESLKESGSRGAGVRVLKGRRTGSSYTSDLSGEGVRRMVRAALDLASITSEDPHAGLPEPEELGRIDADLKLYNDDIASIEAARKIELARETERAALDFDPRITNSEGASFDSYTGQRVFANSRGFLGSFRGSQCSLSTVPVASQDNTMERDYWYSAARSLAALEKPVDIGRIAAGRVLRRLGARKVPTQKAAVVFEPRTARTLIEHIFEAVHGEAIYQQASFLAGKLNCRIASECLTVIDDGTLPGLFGSAPFDDEGVPTRRTPVIERGVLKSYLLNTYTARKLGLKTTGNASRGLAGNAGISHTNLFAGAGPLPPAEIVKNVRRGLFVTELIGFGVNIVTGDYSRGAAGIWIENGEFAYPVSEVTIAGNLGGMFTSIEAIGNDLEFRGSTAAPTILIGEMTISGS
jgi:PmbA protein